MKLVHVRTHGRDPSQPPEITEGNSVVDAAAREVAKEWQKDFLQNLDFHLTNAVACQSSLVAVVVARQHLNNTRQHLFLKCFQDETRQVPDECFTELLGRFRGDSSHQPSESRLCSAHSGAWAGSGNWLQRYPSTGP